MRIFATTAYPDNPFLEKFLNLAANDEHGEHILVGDADSADAVLFVDPPNVEGDHFLKRLRSHSFFRAYPQKCFVYNERDEPFRLFPGLYTSLYARQVSVSRCVTCGYLMTPNQFINYEEIPWSAKDIVCSFIGSRNTHPVRAEILGLNAPGYFLEDTSKSWMFGDGTNFYAYDQAVEIQKRKADYAEIMKRTRFALCPRGKGPNSFRLFEAMQLGCVPVIISDRAALPVGPKWHDFCIFVKECDVESIPSVIKRHLDHASEMAKNARNAYRQFFGAQTHFHHMVSMIEGIQTMRWRFDRVFNRRLCGVYLKQRFNAILRRLLHVK